MLGQQGIISREDARKIAAGLDRVMAEIDRGELQFSPALEDVHMNVESRLKELIGDPASRLHTARSRNDQVATDFRLYVRDWIDGADAALAALQLTLARKAERHSGLIMPGFTHLQPAQPVTFGHHLLAYVEMLERDRQRLLEVRSRTNRLPLGAAALAGTSFPIDRERVARELGFEGLCENSLDAVSDRDFAVEFCAFAALAMVHLSRLAEELVLWTSARFGFVRLPDGGWAAVRPGPGEFVVNLGDMMARWTNERWASTLHRVVNPPLGAAQSRRLSIGMFVHPNYDQRIECVPTCLAAGEKPRYPAITAGEHIKRKIERSHEAA